MQLIKIVILTSFLMTVLQLPASSSEQQIIVNYADENRGNPQYAQPRYRLDHDDERDKFRLRYCYNDYNSFDFSRFIKDFDTMSTIGLPRSIAKDHIISFYLRAHNDVGTRDVTDTTSEYVEPSPNHLLRKNSQLKVELFTGNWSIDIDTGQYNCASGQLYFTIMPDEFVPDNQKKFTFTIKDILLQKALRRRITGISQQSTRAELIKAIDAAKNNECFELINECKIYGIDYKKCLSKKHMRATIKQEKHRRQQI